MELPFFVPLVAEVRDCKKQSFNFYRLPIYI